MAGKTGGEFLAAWKQLDNATKNTLFRTFLDDPVLQPRITPPVKKGTADIESIEATAPNVYSNIQLYPYLSYLYYYPTIHWSLDKTPDTDDYWVGLYDKNEKDDKKYLAYQWIHKAAQGSYKVGRLRNLPYKFGTSRFEEYEVRIFNHGYQRLKAQSNILRGVVNHLPTNPFVPGAEKLLSSQQRKQPDKEIESFISEIRHGALPPQLNPPDIILTKIKGAITETLPHFSLPKGILKSWSDFTPIQKQLIFPILEQDLLPDTIKMPDLSGIDRPEPNIYFAVLVEDVDYPGEPPSHIVLTITLDHSSTYIYPEVDVEDEVPSEGAWLGLYRIHGTADFDPNEYINLHYMSREQKGSHKLSVIKENNPGPTTSNTYVGSIFDNNDQQTGIAATNIEAVISVDASLPPAIFKPDFDKDEALQYAKLSNLAYEEYSTIQQQIVSYGLTADMRIYDSATDTHGFIASNDDSVVITFRGTYSLANWLTNIHFVKKRITERQPFLAHTGFLDAFKKVCKSIEAHIKPSIGKKKIYTTGHSLGGALASLLAFQISHNYESANLTNYVFGCPPVGDINFSEYFKDKRSHIITIQNDPVATGPLIGLTAARGLFQPCQVMFLPAAGSHNILEYIAQMENLP